MSKQSRLASEPLRINIASGPNVLPGYINYDNNLCLLLVPARRLLKRFVPRWTWTKQSERYYQAKQKAPLFYYDCTRPLPFPDLSVDEINCAHFLEHVYRKEAVAIVKDYYRVLKEGGRLVVEVPDLQKYIYQYLESDMKRERADRFIEKTLLTVAARPALWMSILWVFKFFPRHHWLYDEDSLAALVVECGFSEVVSKKVGDESIMLTAIKGAQALMEQKK